MEKKQAAKYFERIVDFFEIVYDAILVIPNEC